LPNPRQRLSKLFHNCFFYNNSFEPVGVLIAGLTGQSLGEAMSERIFAPLGMNSTMFRVPASERARVTTLYMPDMETGEVAPLVDSSLSLDETIRFESAAAGLASTAQDLQRFGRMLLGRGELEGTRVLSEASVAEMFTDQLTAEQRNSPHAAGVLGSGLTWGLGGSISLGNGEMNLPKGAYGWNGGYGTTLFVDPANDLVGVLLTNQVIMSATPAEPLIGFWKLVYETRGVEQE
jgi:CubicO group peptidase (beta-lactamase class C family)